jgi:MFS family permease
MTTLQSFMICGLPVTGMCYSVLGALKLPLAERLNMHEAKVGGLVSSFGFMVGPIILICGFLADALGRRWVWVGGSVLVALSLILLARTNRYIIAVVAVALLSAGWAAMINVGNVLMYLAYPENVFKATNLFDFFFGLGAFLTPTIMVLLIRRFGFKRAVTFVGVIVLFPAIYSLAVEMQGTAVTQPVGFSKVIGDPIMWFCGIILLLWVPIESCTAAWTTTFVKTIAPQGEAPERSARIAAWTLSAFWLCFMGSRLLAAVIYHYGDIKDPVNAARMTHIVLAALTILVLLGIIYSRNRNATIALIIIAGLLYGPFFPNLMAILLSHFPVAVHGRAVGTLFGIASIGWTIIPIVIGAVADKSTLRRGFLVAVATGVALLALVVAHFAYASNHIVN